MYLQIIFISVLLISSAISNSVDQQHHEKGKCLRICNFTGPLPKEKMKGVKKLYLCNSTLDIPDTSYPPYPKMKSFIAKNSPFVEANNNSKWLTAPNLDEIVLDDSPIECFYLQHLNDYHNLKSLRLNKMKIDRIRGKSLYTLNKLKELELIAGEISEIEDDAFDGLYSLEYLNLSNNKIKTISNESLLPLKNLKLLVLSNNPLEKFGPENLPNTSELEKLDLRGVDSKKVDLEGLKKAFPNLEVLVDK